MNAKKCDLELKEKNESEFNEKIHKRNIKELPRRKRKKFKEKIKIIKGFIAWMDEKITNEENKNYLKMIKEHELFDQFDSVWTSMDNFLFIHSVLLN